MNLDLGCGQTTREGYIGMDIHPWPNVDVVFDATAGIPFPDETFDKIWSGMFFEHITKLQVPSILAECHRVLKPGGELDLIVPNLDKILVNFLNTPLDRRYDFPMDTIFGGQAHEGEYHKTGFWPELLTTLLSRAKFYLIRIEEVDAYDQPSLRATATAHE